MESKNKLKETVIKNRMCYYFDDVINGTKISFIRQRIIWKYFSL